MDHRAPDSTPLTLLLDLGQAFHSTLELDPLLVSTLRQLQSAAHSEGGSLWLLGAEGKTLKCTHAIGPGAENVLGTTIEAGQFLAIYQAASQRAIKVDDAARDSAWAEHLGRYIQLRTPRNLILAPLVARGDLLGAVGLVNKLGQASFSAHDLELVSALAGHAALAIQNAQLYERQRHNSERQKLLEQISRHLQQTLDLEVLIPRIFETVNKAINAEAQSIWLLNTEAGVITCRFATGPGAEQVKKVTVPVGKGIVGYTVETQNSVRIEDAQKDARIFRGADDKTGLVTRSLMSVPMVLEGKSIGAIQAINKLNGEPFSPDDEELFRSIADSAALAIENARLFAELQASYDSTLEALTMALDLRDRETEGHSRRVVEYTALLARRLGLDEAIIGDIRRGALIHDIGKIGVPDAVLHKPGPLNPEERKIIEKHPQAGYEMLLGIPYLKEEIKIVLAHQEKWDGTGYPLGLNGETIPLGARLFAIADTFDALTSDRPYRRGLPYEEARRIIASEAGKQFDPRAVEAFLAVPPEEWQDIRRLVMEEVSQRRAIHAEKVRRGHTGMLNPAALKDAPKPG
jgi:putative nucleotidyltransferase with HDIG domain